MLQKLIFSYFFFSDQIMDDEKRNQITSTQLINFNELEKTVPVYIALHIQLRLIFIIFSFFFTNTLSFTKLFFSLSLYWKKKEYWINESFFEAIDTLTMIFWIFWTIILENGFCYKIDEVRGHVKSKRITPAPTHF